MKGGDVKEIELRPIGFVKQSSPLENDRDRSLWGRGDPGREVTDSSESDRLNPGGAGQKGRERTFGERAGCL